MVADREKGKSHCMRELSSDDTIIYYSIEIDMKRGGIVSKVEAMFTRWNTGRVHV
jgi:hypothetical protein